MSALSEWQSFYTIAGSAAGALIGLQFVVLTLIANLPRRVASSQGAAVYSTPTIVHFTTVLVLSGAMVAPWQSVAPVAVLVGLAGVAGVIYSALNARVMRHAAYRPEMEDWVFHAVLPLLAYAVMAGSSVAGFAQMHEAGLFGIAGKIALLLLIGIHNAWDTVTYHVFSRNETDRQ